MSSSPTFDGCGSRDCMVCREPGLRRCHLGVEKNHGEILYNSTALQSNCERNIFLHDKKHMNIIVNKATPELNGVRHTRTDTLNSKPQSLNLKFS